MRKRHQVLLAVSAAIGLSLTPINASATPSTGVHGEILGQVTFDGKDYILRQITIDPGGSTGWHFHDGTLYALIAQGTLSHYRSDCSVDGIYSAGNTLIEPSGSDHVHIETTRRQHHWCSRSSTSIRRAAPLRRCCAS
ncbi:cupin [Rhodococcus sp. 3Y1]